MSLLPELNLDKAKEHIRNAWIAAIISSIITAIIAILPLFGVAWFKSYGYGLWSLCDAALILGLGYGISRNSRVCAIILLISFTSGKVLGLIETAKPNYIALLFIYYFFQGARGTFAYHKITQSYKPNMVKKIIGVSVFLLAVISLTFFAYLGKYGLPSKALSREQISPQLSQKIERAIHFATDEQLLYFYTTGLVDFTKESYILTNKRFVVFEADPKGPVSIPLNRIKDINFLPSQSWVYGGIIEITLDNDNKYSFEVGSEDGGDKNFYDVFQKSINK